MKIQAILVDPAARKVTAIEVPRDDIVEWNRLLGCSTMDMRTVFRPGARAGLVLAVDDTGLTKPNPCFALAGYAHPLAGKALFFGTDRYGETVDAPLSADDCSGLITWIDQEHALAAIRSGIALSAAMSRAKGYDVTTSPDGLVNVITKGKA